MTAAAGPGPSTRADPFAPAGGKQLPAGFGADRADQIQMPASGGSTVQLGLCCWPVLPGFSLSSVHGRSRFRHPDSHRSATSKGGKGNPPSGGGGRSAGSPPPGAGHPDPEWRASAPPPASGVSGERPGPSRLERSRDIFRRPQGPGVPPGPLPAQTGEGCVRGHQSMDHPYSRASSFSSSVRTYTSSNADQVANSFSVIINII